MSKNHTYSIIVCAYNASSTIAACLHSLENLEFNRKRYEIIVVDDGSTDNTVEIVKKFKDVKLVKSDRNHGLAAARNLGLKHSSGGIIISYDADCTSSHDWLTMLDRAYQDNPTASIIAGNLTNGANRTILDQYLNYIGYGNPTRMLKGRGGSLLSRLGAYFEDRFIIDLPNTYYPIHNSCGANASFPADVLRAVNGWNAALRGAEDTDISERLRHQFPDRPMIATPHANLTHNHGLTLDGFLSRPIKRGPAEITNYYENRIFPPIFPMPFVVGILALILLANGLGLAVLILPFVCYPWHIYHYFKQRRLGYLALGYLEFLNEAAGLTGFLYGLTALAKRKLATSRQG